jgi:hypothetical protein
MLKPHQRFPGFTRQLIHIAQKPLPTKFKSERHLNTAAAAKGRITVTICLLLTVISGISLFS